VHNGGFYSGVSKIEWKTKKDISDIKKHDLSDLKMTFTMTFQETRSVSISAGRFP
jgi:hypothetical protein